MKRTYTSEEKLTRWEDARAIKNVMGRMSADYVVKKEKKMFVRYWSTRKDVCLGVNEGWYDGHEAVKSYYDALDRLITLQSKVIAKAFPKELGDKSEAELYGVGTMDYKPIDTPVIEIAADGKTAKGLWTIRGGHAKITTSGPVAYWEWGWFAVDFVKEGDDWKIWHMKYLTEIMRPCSSKWYGEPKKYAEIPEFAEMASFQMTPPNKPCTLREEYGVNRKFTPSPRVPEPYETFDETFTYGIEEVSL